MSSVGAVMKVLLVGSTGGHFKALCQLSDFWQQHDRFWVTFKSSHTRTVLQEETVYWAFGPTNRNLPNLVCNLFLAVSVLLRERPDVVLSTGAGVAVPFLVLGKMMGSKTVFVESFTRVQELSLSARLALPCIDKLYVQWESLQAKYPRSEFIQI